MTTKAKGKHCSYLPVTEAKAETEAEHQLMRDTESGWSSVSKG